MRVFGGGIVAMYPADQINNNAWISDLPDLPWRTRSWRGILRYAYFADVVIMTLYVFPKTNLCRSVIPDQSSHQLERKEVRA